MNLTRVGYYRDLFLIGGIYNIGLSFSLWILGLLDPTKFELFGMTAPPTLFFFHATMGFIFTFGIGYLIVSRNTDKNHAIVILGVIGKSIFFVDCAITFSLGQANTVLLGAGIIDLLFAILFAEFLNSARARAKTR